VVARSIFILQSLVFYYSNPQFSLKVFRILLIPLALVLGLASVLKQLVSLYKVRQEKSPRREIRENLISEILL
jgi:hypothetical protein